MRMVFHRCEFFDAASDLNHSKEFFHRWYMQQTWQATELNIGTWFYVLQQTNVATLYNLQFNDISKSKRKWKLLFKYLLCFVWLGWFGSFAKVREMIWAIFRGGDISIDLSLIWKLSELLNKICDCLSQLIMDNFHTFLDTQVSLAPTHVRVSVCP